MVQEQQTNTSARDLIKQKYNVDEDARVGGERRDDFRYGQEQQKITSCDFINQNYNVDEDV